MELSTFKYGCLLGLHIKEGKRQRQGPGRGIDEQPLSENPGSSNLNLSFSGTQQKLLC